MQSTPVFLPEKAFLDKDIGTGKTIVGVYLRSQLPADVLEARVYCLPGKKIGWFPTSIGDGAPASSAACLNQPFLYDGQVLGLQFHMESTPASVHKIVANCACEPAQGHYIQSVERLLSIGKDVYQHLQSALFGILDRLLVGVAHIVNAGDRTNKILQD